MEVTVAFDVDGTGDGIQTVTITSPRLPVTSSQKTSSQRPQRRMHVADRNDCLKPNSGLPSADSRDRDSYHGDTRSYRGDAKSHQGDGRSYHGDGRSSGEEGHLNVMVRREKRITSLQIMYSREDDEFNHHSFCETGADSESEDFDDCIPVPSSLRLSAATRRLPIPPATSRHQTRIRTLELQSAHSESTRADSPKRVMCVSEFGRRDAEGDRRRGDGERNREGRRVEWDRTETIGRSTSATSRRRETYALGDFRTSRSVSPNRRHTTLLCPMSPRRRETPTLHPDLFDMPGDGLPLSPSGPTSPIHPAVMLKRRRESLKAILPWLNT